MVTYPVIRYNRYNMSYYKMGQSEHFLSSFPASLVQDRQNMEHEVTGRKSKQGGPTVRRTRRLPRAPASLGHRKKKEKKKLGRQPLRGTNQKGKMVKRKNDAIEKEGVSLIEEDEGESSRLFG